MVIWQNIFNIDFFFLILTSTIWCVDRQWFGYTKLYTIAGVSWQVATFGYTLKRGYDLSTLKRGYAVTGTPTLFEWRSDTGRYWWVLREKTVKTCGWWLSFWFLYQGGPLWRSLPIWDAPAVFWWLQILQRIACSDIQHHLVLKGNPALAQCMQSLGWCRVNILWHSSDEPVSKTSWEPNWLLSPINSLLQQKCYSPRIIYRCKWQPNIYFFFILHTNNVDTPLFRVLQNILILFVDIFQTFSVSFYLRIYVRSIVFNC